MKKKDQHNDDPYFNGRREWDERFGGYVEMAIKWRQFAILLTFALLITVGLLGWVGAQSKVKTFVVRVDNAGYFSVDELRDERDENTTEALLKSFLHRWIVSARRIVRDASIKEQDFEFVYALVPANSAALNYLNSHYHTTEPYKRMLEETAKIEVEKLLRQTGDTWRIEWVETRYTLTGVEIDKTSYTAFLDVFLAEELTDELVRQNPLGIFIRDLSWDENLQ